MGGGRGRGGRGSGEGVLQEEETYVRVQDMSTEHIANHSEKNRPRLQTMFSKRQMKDV